MKKNLRLLVGTTIINDVLFLFLNTFFVSYFYTISKFSYQRLSLYYVMVYLAILVTFLVLGNFVKQKSPLLIFRLGIISYFLYLIVIAFLKENVINYYLFLGIFYGVVQGTYWSGAHSLINQFTKKTTTKKFVSEISIFSKIIKIAFPLILGTSIEFYSFNKIVFCVTFLSLVQFCLSLFIKEKTKLKTQPFNIRKYLKVIKNKNLDTNRYYKIVFLEGIVKYFLETLVVIVITMTFKRSLDLGILTTVFSICSAFAVYLYYKFSNKKNNKIILNWCAFMAIIGVLGLILDINRISIIFYTFVNGFFMIILTNYSFIKRYDCLPKNILGGYVVEHQAVSDIFLCSSRIISYLILFMVSFSTSILPFKFLLIIVAICIIIFTKQLTKLES